MWCKAMVMAIAIACPLAAQQPEPPAGRRTGQPAVQQPAPVSATERARRAMERARRRAQSLQLPADASVADLVAALDYDHSTVLEAARLLAGRGVAARAALTRLGEQLDVTANREEQLALVAAMLAIDPMAPESCPAHHDRLCNGTTLERRRAALALGTLGAAAAPAVRAMISATREEDDGVVNDAVTGLGMLGVTAESALIRLRELEERADEQLAVRARVAIVQIEEDLERAAARGRQKGAGHGQ